MHVDLIEPVPFWMAVAITRAMREADRHEIACLLPQRASLEGACAWWWESAGHSFACRLDGRPVAMVLAGEQWPGCWWLAAWASDDWRSVVLSVSRGLRRRREWFWRNGVNRLECRAAAWRTDTHQWITAMGGECETVLRAYGRNGEDYHLYRWLNPTITKGN